MELFIMLGAVWVVGMVAYIVLSGKSGNKVYRCNVRDEVIKFKRINNEMNRSTKTK